ncbi:MAG: AmmeMemoRadiSam system protein B [Clostridia bacterium]|nr:AmmeMemoRadiSam system protein B [Clostridia bacterium]
MKKRTVGLVCLLIFFWGILAFDHREREAFTYLPVQENHPNNFFDSRYFIRELSESPEAPGKRIYGAVVPHHLLAYEMIAEVFNHLRDQEPPLIVLIGPNHNNQGERIITSTWGWQTPFGTVEPDREAIADLVATSLVKVNNEIFSQEHSMGNLMPFLKYFLPEAKVVPIVFHHDLKKEEGIILSQVFSRLVEEREGIIIASVDFSHYLTNKEAQEKDRETLRIIENRNIAELLKLGDDHLDSPGAMMTLLLTMDRLNVRDFRILGHTNSGILIGNDLIETTSYFTFVFQ